jgi:hypothetical protein
MLNSFSRWNSCLTSLTKLDRSRDSTLRSARTRISSSVGRFFSSTICLITSASASRYRMRNRSGSATESRTTTYRWQDRSYAHTNTSRRRSTRVISYTPSVPAMYARSGTSTNDNGQRSARMSGILAARRETRLFTPVRSMPAEGFEPPTYGLQNRCTTTVLSRHVCDRAWRSSPQGAFYRDRRPCTQNPVLPYSLSANFRRRSGRRR